MEEHSVWLSKLCVLLWLLNLKIDEGKQLSHEQLHALVEDGKLIPYLKSLYPNTGNPFGLEIELLDDHDAETLDGAEP